MVNDKIHDEFKFFFQSFSWKCNWKHGGSRLEKEVAVLEESDPRTGKNKQICPYDDLILVILVQEIKYNLCMPLHQS